MKSNLKSVRWTMPAAMVLCMSLLQSCGDSSPVSLTLPNPPPAPATPPEADLTIKVLSSRPDLVTGGDALIEVTGSQIPTRMQLNGQDVTAQFATRGNGRYMALLQGLTEGRNLVTAFAGERQSRIEVINHPEAGPLFAGEQVQPWPCLPGATDAQCSRPVSYRLLYKPTGQTTPCAQDGTPEGCGSFKPYDPANPPGDVDTTVTDQGKTVPYILRVETGSQDRGQYMFVVLYDPSKPWEPWAPQEGWNGKIYNIGGANCGTYHGETVAPDVLPFAYAFSKGYLVWSTSLSHNQFNCSPTTHAESLVMAREAIVEHYGPVRFSFGQGQSGGSIKAQQAANEFPGLYDGLNVVLSFPDIWSTLQETYDCGLMVNYWRSPQLWAPGTTWTEAEWAAAAGHQSISVCVSWNQAFIGVLAPRDIGQVCDIPADQLYDPATNPEGKRCALQDFMRSQFGLRPPERWGPIEQQIGRGFANRPLDNVGVQYGLSALRGGQISVAQFIDLNAHIGGYDIDLNIVPERMEADPAALPVVYRSGMINQATQMTMPILDLRAHDLVELHHDYRSYVMRARLDRAHGHHDNQVIWTGPIPLFATYDPRTGAPLFEIEAFGVMDGWLSAIEADESATPLAQKVVNNKPAAARDKCTDASATELPADSCPILYPYDASPRIVADQPFTDDVVKCQLKPLDPGDYGDIVFSEAQWAQLEAIYPTGVCDYTKPGVGQQAALPFLDFSAGPGGVPLPPLPTPEGWSGPVFRRR
ncbi:MAG: DUF6351 family protein [Pseudomonadota bacterium]